MTLADPTRVDDTGKRPVLRPRIQVVTTEPVPVPVGRDAVLAGPPGAEGEGGLRDARRRRQDRGGAGAVRRDGPRADRAAGQRAGGGRAALPDHACREASCRRGAFPAPEETPWTHGGPPGTAAAPQDPAPAEDWS